jgi:ERCC4-type nuclease
MTIRRELIDELLKEYKTPQDILNASRERLRRSSNMGKSVEKTEEKGDENDDTAQSER